MSCFYLMVWKGCIQTYCRCVHHNVKLRPLRECVSQTVPYQPLSGAARQTAGGPWGKFSGILPCDGPPGTEKIEHQRKQTYSNLSSTVFRDVCLILAWLISIRTGDYWQLCYTAYILCFLNPCTLPSSCSSTRLLQEVEIIMLCWSWK